MAKKFKIYCFFVFIISPNYLSADIVDSLDDFKPVKQESSETKVLPKRSLGIQAEQQPTEQKNELDKPKSGSKTDFSKCKIFFKCKGIKGIRNNGVLELQNDVFVKKCDLELRANRAYLYFDNKTNEIKKIEAFDKVQINNFNRETRTALRASGDKLYYNHTSQILELEGLTKGNPAKMSRGANIFSGDKIVYNILEDSIVSKNIEGIIDSKSDVWKKQP